VLRGGEFVPDSFRTPTGIRRYWREIMDPLPIERSGRGVRLARQ
jgi:hypothetical protein